LVGIFPPESSDNILSDWQQQNAVPPLSKEAMDYWAPYFAEWQAELGDQALLDSINTFVILMDSHKDDLMLKLTANNCPAFGQALKDNYPTLKDMIKGFETDLFPRLEHMFGYCGIGLAEAVEMCQYLQWADLHNVELQFTYTQDDLDECQGLDVAMIEYFNIVDESLQFIASTQFRKYISDHMKSAMGAMSYEETVHSKKQVAAARSNRLDLEASNMKPEYVFFMTSHVNMKMMLNALIPSDIQHAFFHQVGSAPVPSSTLIFTSTLQQTAEENGSGMYIEAKFNDEIVPLGGCANTYTPCKLEDFVSWLEDSIKIPDVLAFCNAVSKPVEVVQ